MDKIVQHIQPGIELPVPSGKSTFKVQSISEQRVSLRVGGGYGAAIAIPSQCWEGIPHFLRGRGWVEIGATHDKPRPGTLDAFVQGFTGGVSAASYVAAILEKAGLSQIHGDRPQRVRLLD